VLISATLQTGGRHQLAVFVVPTVESCSERRQPRVSGADLDFELQIEREKEDCHGNL